MDIVWLQQVLVDTPFWVYGILLYLIIAGFKLSKPRIIPFKRLYRIPTILVISSFTDFFKLGGSFTEIAASWCVATFMGIAFAWWILVQLDMQLDKDNQLVKVPGTWANLIVLLLFFSVKYYVGYQLIVGSTRLTDLSIIFSIAVILGICAGFYLGILLYANWHMKRTTTAISLK